MYSTLKRVFIGPPIASTEEHHQRLPKVVALAVFASDAISSTAYATEEILIVLVPLGGVAAFEDLVPIALIVVALLAVVVTSYRQTIHAYPNGGGSYVVSRENLGRVPSLVAAASLLVDYILTVAVSVSAGTAGFFAKAGFPAPRSILIVPLRVKDRVAGWLYADDGGNKITTPDIPSIHALCSRAGLALQILILRNKILTT